MNEKKKLYPGSSSAAPPTHPYAKDLDHLTKKCTG